MITAGHHCCQDITLQLSLQIQKIYKKNTNEKKRNEWFDNQEKNK